MEVERSPRWLDLDLLLTRSGNLAAPGFEAGPELRDFLHTAARVLCVGAGGLGCEILKDLALCGFVHIDVIDMDTIDVSNLNRQFLFRTQDVGQPKAVVAAKRINERVSGAAVTPHFARIEDKDAEFYSHFTIIVLGLDSLEARRYMNSVACSFLEYDEDGKPDTATIKPVVDGGTEGLKGHARVIYPGITPCFECTLWLFPPQTKFPLCTLAETPRTAPHCIEYAHLIQWPQQRADEEFDTDNEEHMKWVYEKAMLRASHFGITLMGYIVTGVALRLLEQYCTEGVSFQLTQGVVKNIVPAIASTNAIVSAACVLEALKIVTLCSTGLNNYMMYSGSQGIYTHTAAYELDPNCVVCGAGVLMELSPQRTLQQVIDSMLEHPYLKDRLHAPSVSYGTSALYMRGVLEEATCANLVKKMSELLDMERQYQVLTVNDKSLSAPLRVRLKFVHDDTVPQGQ